MREFVNSMNNTSRGHDSIEESESVKQMGLTGMTLIRPPEIDITPIPIPSESPLLLDMGVR